MHSLICHQQLDQFLGGGRRLACIKCHVDCHLILIGFSNERTDSTRIPNALWSRKYFTSHILFLSAAAIYTRSFPLQLYEIPASSFPILKDRTPLKRKKTMYRVQHTTCIQEHIKITQDIYCLFKTTNDSLPSNTSLPNPNMQESFN